MPTHNPQIKAYLDDLMALLNEPPKPVTPEMLAEHRRLIARQMARDERALQMQVEPELVLP